MRRKITIIGANSYIARNMIHLLRNHQDQYELFLYDIQNRHFDAEETYECVNVLLEEDLNRVRLDVDAVYLFSGITGSEAGFKNYRSFVEINELPLLGLLNLYRKKESEAKLIFPSTRLVYQGSDELLSESGTKRCNSVYAINKYACEQYLELYQKAFDIRYAIFRICVPYGTLVVGASSYGTAEFMQKQAASEGCITLYGDGSVRRTVTHIEDLCKILIAGGLNEYCLNDVYNIGGENYSLLDMARTIARYQKVDIQTIPWPQLAGRIESGSTVFDSGKLDHILHPHYQHTFEKWCAR